MSHSLSENVSVVTVVSLLTRFIERVSNNVKLTFVRKEDCVMPSYNTYSHIV